mgnify:CR=1 FL=1
MADAKIEVEVGQFRFSGEGEQQWLAQQMDKILKSAESLTKLAPPPTPQPPSGGGNEEKHGGDDSEHRKTTDALPQFLQKANATKSQVDKFLATAEWLHRKGNRLIKTGDVTAALREAHQGKLANASVSLASNSKKGYCVKDGGGFYVTDEGRTHLGLQ